MMVAVCLLALPAAGTAGVTIEACVGRLLQLNDGATNIPEVYLQ